MKLLVGPGAWRSCLGLVLPVVAVLVAAAFVLLLTPPWLEAVDEHDDDTWL